MLPTETYPLFSQKFYNKQPKNSEQNVEELIELMSKKVTNDVGICLIVLRCVKF